MAIDILEILESKGIENIPKDHYSELTMRWRAIEAQKQSFNQSPLDDYDIALRNLPGGDHIDR